MLTIRELSTATGVSAHTLRYYEKAGLMPPVERRPNGHRRYDPGHVFWVAFLCRLRATGMTIAEIREYAALANAGDSTLAERQRLLGEHREKLLGRIAELEDSLELLDLKLAFYYERRAGTCPPDFLDYLARHGRQANGSRGARPGDRTS